jgi:hypothetical protein
MVHCIVALRVHSPRRLVVVLHGALHCGAEACLWTDELGAWRAQTVGSFGGGASYVRAWNARHETWRSQMCVYICLCVCVSVCVRLYAACTAGEHRVIGNVNLMSRRCIAENCTKFAVFGLPLDRQAAGNQNMRAR